MEDDVDMHTWPQPVKSGGTWVDSIPVNLVQTAFVTK